MRVMAVERMQDRGFEGLYSLLLRMTSKPHESRKAWSPSFLEVTKAASIILADAKCGDEKPVMVDRSQLGSYEEI